MGEVSYQESDQEKSLDYRIAGFVLEERFRRGNVAAPRRPVRRSVSRDILRAKRAEAEARRIEANTRALAVDWERWRQATKDVTPLRRR
jgi:hypothetical protein